MSFDIHYEDLSKTNVFEYSREHAVFNANRIRNVFVTSGKPKKSRGNGPWDRLEKFCNESGIELVEVNSITKDLIVELRSEYPTREKVGREEGIARFLIHLIHNNFLKEENL